MKKIIMSLVLSAGFTLVASVNFEGKSVDEIFSLLDQALIKAFENRTLSKQGLDVAAKKDFEAAVNAAFAIATRASAFADVKNALAQLPNQLSQLMVMTDYLKDQPATAKKRAVEDIKSLRATAADLEQIGLNTSIAGIMPDLYAKWDAEAQNIEVERSRKEKLLFKSGKLKEEQLLTTPEQRAFFKQYMQLAPSRDLKQAEMDGLLLQSGVTNSRRTKLINGYAIENLIDALGKYAYFLTNGRADAPQKEKVTDYAYDLQRQLRNLYGISRDEGLLINKAPTSAALLYKISSIYTTIWDQLLKELGAA